MCVLTYGTGSSSFRRGARRLEARPRTVRGWTTAAATRVRILILKRKHHIDAIVIRRGGSCSEHTCLRTKEAGLVLGLRTLGIIPGNHVSTFSTTLEVVSGVRFLDQSEPNWCSRNWRSVDTVTKGVLKFVGWRVGIRQACCRNIGESTPWFSCNHHASFQIRWRDGRCWDKVLDGRRWIGAWCTYSWRIRWSGYLRRWSRD